jgi:6-phosphofructokinase 2
MKSIVTLTANPVIDVAASVPKVFPDHKLRCGVARCRWGRHRCFSRHPAPGRRIFRLLFRGRPSGDMLEALLDAETLLHRRLPIKEWTRENFTATEEATGSQFRFALRGPELSKKEWQRGLDLLASVEPTPDFAIASGSLATGLPNDCYAHFARAMRKRSACVIIDTSASHWSKRSEPEFF